MPDAGDWLILKGMKLILAGGTGQVGELIARSFKGHEVRILSRDDSRGTPYVKWDAKTLGPWSAEVDGADVVIGLAGRNVNCRYTEKNKKEMIESRVDSTRVLGEAIARASSPPRVWLQMSTATIYAHNFGPPYDESGMIGGGEPGAPKSWDFSIEIARAWEDTLMAANTPRTRRVALRAALVLSPDRGGIFDMLHLMTRVGLGGGGRGWRSIYLVDS